MAYKIIAAFSGEKRVIGNAGKIPWHLPEDFKHFKTTTQNRVIVMGRKTYDSLGMSGLPNRHIVVLTRKNTYGWNSLTQDDPRKPSIRVDIYDEKIIPALDGFAAEKDVWICGGAEIYSMFLPKCVEAIISEVHGSFEGDSFMPELSKFKNREKINAHDGFDIYRYS